MLSDIGIQPIIVDRTIPAKSGPFFYTRLLGNLFSSLPYSVATHTSSAMRESIEKLTGTILPIYGIANGPPTTAQSLRNSQAHRIPWLVMVHNLESLIWQRDTETESNPLKRRYMRRQWKKYEAFERWAYRSASVTIAVQRGRCPAHGRERFGAERVEVVDNGVDTAIYAPDSPSLRDPRRVLFLGSLDWGLAEPRRCQVAPG